MSGAVAATLGAKAHAFLNHPAGTPGPGRVIRLGDSSPSSRLRTVLTLPSPHLDVHSDTGPKTVFFWAPMAKWALVAAGFRDLTRPANKLSVAQSVGACSTLSLLVSILFPLC